jgi:hypothetical protein
VAAEQIRPDVLRKRARWKAYQDRIDRRRLVFIDETWVKTNMSPLRGWGPRGQRLRAMVPYGHWKTVTFLAALRHDRIDAPWVVDGPINGELFKLYVRQILVPTLNPGDIVVLDNLGCHKSHAVRSAIRGAGARLFFLPPQLTRPKPDRTGLRQTQALAAKGQRAHRRKHMAPRWRAPRPLPSRRMPKLSDKRRLCFRLKSSRSSVLNSDNPALSAACGL